MKRNYPVRILQIIGIVCGGGVESVIMNYYRHIDRRKIQFDFVIDGKNKSLLDDEITMMGGRVYHVTPYRKNIVRYMYDVYMIMKNNSYDIIHDNMNTMALFSLFPAWLAGNKVRIIHNHTTNAKANDEKLKYLMKLFLRPLAKKFANRFVACSHYAGEWMYGEQMMKAHKVRIINNAIEINKFSFSTIARRKLRMELDVDDRTVVIGHIGRLSPQKNQLFLLELFVRYLKINSNARLVIIGDGPMKEALIAKVHDLKIETKVQLLGLRKDVSDWYSAFDLFLLPSLYEGLPVVAIEAQANGVPICLSTAITKEAVINSQCMHLNLSEIEDWVDACVKLAGKRLNGTDIRVREHGFSIKDEAYKLEDFYLHDI